MGTGKRGMGGRGDTSDLSAQMFVIWDNSYLGSLLSEAVFAFLSEL